VEVNVIDGLVVHACFCFREPRENLNRQTLCSG
jgi:hypothetical protein